MTVNDPRCRGCGSCCADSILVEPTDKVPALLTRDDGDRTWMRLKAGSRECIALDPSTRLCKIYDARPQVCREFEVGSTQCATAIGYAARQAERRALIATRTIEE